MKCDMEKDCARPVTHISEKGWLYCTEHRTCRNGYERCRKLRKWELDLIRAGQTLPSYKYKPRPKPPLVIGQVRVEVEQVDPLTFIKTVPLVSALWYFIENANDDAAWRTEAFFELRQRVYARGANFPTG